MNMNSVSQKEYQQPILETLYEGGGAMRDRAVIDQVGQRFESRYNATDHEIVATGDPRWVNNVRWARFGLVEQGLIIRTRHAGTRGIWELTADGILAVELSVSAAV